jgi:hypothetical protein
MAVLEAFLVRRLGHPGRRSGGGASEPGPGLLGCLVGDQEVIVAEVFGGCVGLDLGNDLLAELEPPVFLVLRVVLDQEPASVGVLVASELDNGAADGQDAGREVQVANPDPVSSPQRIPLSMSVSTSSFVSTSGSAWYSRSNWTAVMMRRGFSGRAVSSPRDWGEWRSLHLPLP